MAELTGNEILARCLKAQGVKDLFFIMGGPMLDAELTCIKEGIRLIDTRHEQGASYMAQAYSRVTQGPGDPEFRHWLGQCGDRLLSVRGDRRIQPDQPVRPPSLSGDRSGQMPRRPGQIRRPRAQSEAYSAAGEFRVPDRAAREARPRLSRFSRRRALLEGRGRPGRLELYGPADIAPIDLV